MSQSIFPPVCHSIAFLLLCLVNAVSFTGAIKTRFFFGAHHSQIVFFFFFCRHRGQMRPLIRLSLMSTSYLNLVATEAALTLQAFSVLHRRPSSSQGTSKHRNWGSKGLFSSQPHQKIGTKNNDNNRTKVLKQTYYKVKGPLKCN